MTAESVAWAKRTAFGSPTKKLVMLVVADACDAEWSCFPGQATLARQTELGERTVRRLLAELEADGWLRRERRQRANGSRTSDRIYLVPDGPATAAGNPRPEPDPLPAADGRPTGQPVSPLPATAAGPPEPPVEPPAEPPDLGHVRGQLALVADPTPAALPPPAHVLGSDRDVWFARFWELYPRKVAKGAARTAWAAALRRGKARPEEIIAGAERYAADPNRDPAYTAHPATWLNAERWGDEPEPDRTAPAPAGPPRTAMGKTMSHLRGLAAGHAAAPPPRQLGAG